jgi:hypothetical protein
MRILKKAGVASVVVLHRHSLQENDRKAMKTSFVIANSLVTVLSDCLVNAYLHVTAKGE